MEVYGGLIALALIHFPYNERKSHSFNDNDTSSHVIGHLSTTRHIFKAIRLTVFTWQTIKQAKNNLNISLERLFDWGQ